MKNTLQYVIDHKEALSSYVHKILRNYELIDDVLQEAMVKLHLYKKKVASPKSFVYQVVRNTALRFTKTNKTMKGPRKQLYCKFDIATHSTPESLLIQKEVYNLVDKSIEELNTDKCINKYAHNRGTKTQYKVIKMVLASDDDNVSIARRNKINENTFKANYRHGILKLRQKIDCVQGYYIPASEPLRIAEVENE